MGNLDERRDIPRLITSNLLEEVGENYAHAYSYNNCVYFSEVFCEDSTLMLLKILQTAGCRKLGIAGFDGFLGREKVYYVADYTKESGKNIEINKVIGILQTSLSNMEIYFVTKSNYDPKAREK